jgi:hypothetical protein
VTLKRENSLFSLHLMGLFLHFYNIASCSKTVVASSRTPRHHHSRMLATIQPAIRGFILAAVCGLLMSAAVRAEDRVPPSRTELGKADWSVKASPNLAKHPPAEKAVEQFVRSQVARSEDDSVMVDLCSFKFADLRHNGNLSLVAGVDYRGRGLCASILIIDHNDSDFLTSGIEGANGAAGNVSAALKDLQNDGNLEIRADRSLGEILGRCGAFFPVIYAWRDLAYADVSAQFKDFYRGELNSLEKAVAGLRPDIGPNGESLDSKECLEAEAAAIQRFLGMSPDAGIDQAIRLANSKDAAERDFAVNILYKIGTPKAWQQIEILSRDPDFRVAFEAKRYLSFLTKGPTPIPPRPIQTPNVGDVHRIQATAVRLRH